MNEFKILKKLGKGSYGEVYLAQNLRVKSKCVIKQVKVSHLNHKDIENAKKEVKVCSKIIFNIVNNNSIIYEYISYNNNNNNCGD